MTDPDPNLELTAIALLSEDVADLMFMCAVLEVASASLERTE